jgi:hypothetical protein
MNALIKQSLELVTESPGCADAHTGKLLVLTNGKNPTNNGSLLAVAQAG